MTSNSIYKLADCSFNPEAKTLKSKNQELSLKPLHAKLLLHFVVNSGEAFSIDELKVQVWQQEHLSDGAVKKAISEVRAILKKASGDDRTFIETVPQLGYRLGEQILSIKQKPYKKIVSLLALTLIIAVAAYQFLSSKTQRLALVETKPAPAQVVYSEQVRQLFLDSLGKTFDVSLTYSQSNKQPELVLNYHIDSENNLSAQLSEGDLSLWQKQVRIDSEFGAKGRIIIDEISTVLDRELNYSVSFIDSQPQAYELFVRGKILYYQNGTDTGETELMLLKSLELQPNNNPSNAALLDLYGLEERSLRHSQRNDKLKQKIKKHIAKLTKEVGRVDESAVALAKYQLVNQGNAIEALKLIEKADLDAEQVYDLHIPALSYALNNDKAKSNQLISFAEKRFPERNAIVWYKALIHLVNGDFRKAEVQSQWAQSIAPDWYPLVYITPKLVAGNEKDALKHLQSFQHGIFDNRIKEFDNLSAYSEHFFRNIKEINLKPFEVEIAYLLSLHFSNKQAEEYIFQFTKKHYPEKMMMLNQVKGWMAR